MRLLEFSQSKYFIWVFLFVALITHIPTGKSVLLGDDFIQWASSVSPAALSEKGFSIADRDNSFSDRIQNMFLFMSADNTATAELKHYGAVPWWVADNVTMHMFRPLSGVTHWLDYNFWGDDVFLMQLHSVLYLLLLAASLYLLCRQLNAPMWAPALAITFFVFSYSVPQNLSWLAARNALIAPTFAIWAIIFHHWWRSKDNIAYLPLSMVALLLAVLSAEAGIATLAYLGAYALVLDTKPFFRRIWTILPALFVVVIWRLGYSSLGFGTENIDLYVDPVRSPMEFIAERIPMLPMYYARIVLGPLALIMLSITSNILLLSLMSIVVCSLVLWPLWKYLKKDSLMQFGLIGSVVAIIPFLATNPSPRSDPFLHIGFFLMVAMWLYHLSVQGGIKKRLTTFVVAFLIVHLVIPSVLTVGRHWRIVTIEVKGMDAYSSVQSELENGDKDLVIVNSPDFFAYYHRPFGWAYENLPLPNRIMMLAPGLTSMTVERLSEQRYRLVSEEGFATLSDSPKNIDTREDPHLYRPKVLAYKANNQIMTNKEVVFNQGERFNVNGMAVSIVEAVDGMPKVLEISLDDPNNAVWQWFDWSDNAYKKFDELKVGQKVFIPGPFHQAESV